MSNKDYYSTLGVAKGATDEEIKKAYKQQVKKYHPDLNPDSATAEEKMKEVNEAYEVLSNKEKRARYDQFGADGVNGNYGAGGFGGGFGGNAADFGDIFDMFFGGAGGRSGARQQNMARQGDDLRLDVKVSFEEAAKGTSREVPLTRTESCADCGGSGAKAGTGRVTCAHCGGSGQVSSVQATAFGQFQTVKACPRCGGRGSVVETPCPSCSGSGRVRKQRKIKINIPAGVDNDSRLRMSGEGEGGFNGGPSGDLYIFVTVEPHSYFRRNGDDILCDLPITMVQAALGDEVEVETLDGRVKLTIPEGTQSGTSFRLRGRGFPKLRGYGKGDQNVKVSVTTPRDLTAEQRELLRQFAASTGVEPKGSSNKSGGSKSDKNKSDKNKGKDKPKGFFNKIKDTISGE
ncbi:MAG: molecular chaperone DnaJ [Firmicutes bacterium]|nr:molecular chaperone DnaJ [Bacillota bacterium]